MPLVECEGSGGTNAHGVYTCFAMAGVDGGKRWDRSTHTYLPLAFIRERLLFYQQRRLDLTDALLFFVFFVFYMVFLDFEYLSRMDSNFWAGSVVRANFESKRFRPIIDIRPLQHGEVDLYHSGRSFLTMRNGDDWHHWLRDVVIDGLFNASDPLRHRRGGNYFFEGGQAVLIGALRVRAIRMKGSCQPNKGCDYGYGISSIDQDDFGPLRWASCPRWVAMEGDLSFYTCSGVVLDIPFSKSHTEAVAMVNSLRSGTFDIVDMTSVRGISAEFVMYLPGTDSFVLSTAFTEIPRSGGGLLSKTITTVLPSRTPTERTALFATCSACTAAILVMLIYRSVAGFWRPREAQQTWKRAVLWWLHVSTICGHLVCYGIRVFTMPALAVDGSDDAFATSLWEPFMLYRIEIHFGALSALFAVVRMLTVFHFVPLLKIVTITIAVAFRNMLGIGLAFFMLIAGYAVAGYFLFNDSVYGFRSGWPALQTVVRALLGDFDYEDLRTSVPGPSAIIYYWSFMLLTPTICLNFIVGILAGALRRTTDADSKDADMHSNASFFGRIAQSIRQIRWELSVHASVGFVDDLLQTVLELWREEISVIEDDAFDDGNAEYDLRRLRDATFAVRVVGEMDLKKRFVLLSCARAGLPKQFAMNYRHHYLPCYNISDFDLFVLHERRCERCRAGGSTRSKRKNVLSRVRDHFARPSAIPHEKIHLLWYANTSEAPANPAAAQGLSHQFANQIQMSRQISEDLGSVELRRALDVSYGELLSELDDLTLMLKTLSDWYGRRGM